MSIQPDTLQKHSPSKRDCNWRPRRDKCLNLLGYTGFPVNRRPRPPRKNGARLKGVSLKRLVRWPVLAFLSVTLVTPVVSAQEAAKPLTVQAIFGSGSLAGTPPHGISWSPDGQHLTYLDGGELVDIDPGSGKPHILVGHAKLATLGGKEKPSEQDRDHRERYGMASYLWAPDSKHLMFDSNGSLWIYDLANGTGVQIGLAGEESGDDPRFSPNGEFVSFVRNHGLAVVPLRDPGTPTVMVAPAPNPNTLNGEVDWVYEEELATRSNYFWSPDSKSLAFLQTIEDNVPEYPIVDWIPAHATVEKQRYPQPGDANPDVRVGVVNAKGGKTNWVHIPIAQGQDYIPRFGWVDRKTLWVETLSRDQKHRRIYFADPGSGTAHSVLEISDEKFLDLDYDVYVAHGSIVLTSWSDGHRHIYLYQYDEGRTDSTTAKLVKQLTSGDFDVAEIYRVDSSRKEVFYASNEGAPLERQAWQVSFDGERKQLTAGAGFHDADFAPVGGNFADRFSTRVQPPVVQLCGVGSSCKTFWASHALDASVLSAPEQFEVKARDGSTLYATLLMPAKTNGAASVPLIVNPYGGPAIQHVRTAGATICSSMRCSRNTVSLSSTLTTAARQCADAISRKPPIAASGPSSLKISSPSLMQRFKSIPRSMPGGWVGGVRAGAAASRCTP